MPIAIIEFQKRSDDLELDFDFFETSGRDLDCSSVLPSGYTRTILFSRIVEDKYPAGVSMLNRLDGNESTRFSFVTRRSSYSTVPSS